LIAPLFYRFKNMAISIQKIHALKRLSHQLKPVILLGANGLTDSVHTEIERALYDHELIKIKLCSKDKAEKQLLTDTICQLHNATFITQIGHVITIYKRSDKNTNQ